MDDDVAGIIRQALVLGIPWAFGAGAFLAGLSTSRPAWKTLDTCAVAVMVVGVRRYRFTASKPVLKPTRIYGFIVLKL